MSSFYLLALFLGLCVQDTPLEPTSHMVAPIMSIELDATGKPVGKEQDNDISAGKMCCVFLGLASESLQHPILKTLLLYNVISGLTPSPGLATFYFLNDVVGITPYQTSMLTLIGYATHFFMMLIFEYCLRGVSIRIIYFIVCLLKIASGFAPYFLVLPASEAYSKTHTCSNSNGTHITNGTCYYYQEHNLDPFPLALSDNIVGELLDDLQSMPLAIVTKTVCYNTVGATVYTFTLSVQNGVTYITSWLNAVLMSYFGINHDNYIAFPDFIKMCTVWDVLVMLLGLPFIPHVSTKTLRDQVDAERVEKKEVSKVLNNLEYESATL
jgi:hypothetical protein